MDCLKILILLRRIDDLAAMARNNLEMGDTRTMLGHIQAIEWCARDIVKETELTGGF